MTARAFAVFVAVAAMTVPPTVPAWAQPQAPTAGAIRLDVGAGSKATYRVREQLARLNLPNDAVGETGTVTGSLVLRPDGTFTADSKLSVDLRTIKSDEARRDAFLRENTLHTDKFPLAEFVPTRVAGVTMPLPASGPAKFQLVGNMTIHGTTASQTLDVVATLAPDAISATATTRITFGKYGITPPKLLGLVSVEDDIRLEIVLKARRTPVK